MGRPTLTEDRRKAVRLQIKDAALGLYREQGLEAITMRAVGARIGLAPSAIYAHFEGRRALLESLWQEPVFAAAREARVVADATPDPVERIRAMLAVYMRLAADHADIYRGAFLYVRPGSIPAPPSQPMASVEFHQLLAAAVAEAQAAGRMRSGNPGMISQSLWAALHGALALPINLEILDFAAPQALAAHTVDLVVSGLLV